MIWRSLHRWLALTMGSAALILALTGTILATQPAIDAFKAVPAAGDMPVATLAERILGSIAGVEQIRRLSSGDIIVYSYNEGQAQMARINPADGSILESSQPSGFSRWVKNLHRSFLLGDTGRIAAAAVAMAMLLISISGLILTARRLGGWQRLGAHVRGSGLQRLHVVGGRIALLAMVITSVTALYMSAATFGLVPAGSGFDPEVASQINAGTDLPPQELPLLRELRVGELHKLSLPSADDPKDTWHVTTDHGAGWIDRTNGQTLAWQESSAAQGIYDWVMLLHTGKGAWGWALVLGAMSASIPLFWFTGMLLWLQGRRQAPKITQNSPLREADTLLFVASEGGSTWGFAQALQQALTSNGHRVHVAALEQFQATDATRHVFVLAATYGDGQAPAHAAHALARIGNQPVGNASVTVLGFGDRQFSDFCGYAQAIDEALRARGWQELLPLERIHQQSPQEFVRWGKAVAQSLNEPLTLDYVPRIPATHSFTLTQREDFAGADGTQAAILHFALPRTRWIDRLLGRGLPRFDAGDLVGFLPPGSTVPRYYSLASGTKDGFLEICVGRVPGGACSGYLHELQPGDIMQGFIKSNPGFVLDGRRRPVLLIGAGTGVAPLAGFIRGNRRRTPMHLYFGSRDPARDFYFGSQIESWLADRRLSSLATAFSRTSGGGGYVQDSLRRDAAQVRDLVAQGATVRVCGSRPMATGVVQALDEILQALHLSVAQLKQKGRYAEDVF